MDTKELKFILKLLGFKDYRASVSEIKPSEQIKAAERNNICRKLCDRGLLECSYEVTKLKIAPPGKALLKLEQNQVPITEQELKVLQASEKAKITPAQTKISVAQRQTIIQSLAERGLIEIETKIKEVWLSIQGQKYLRDEYKPTGNSTISLNMLNNYVNFLRRYLSSTELSVKVNNGDSPSAEQSNISLSDLEILQTIRDLDQQLATDNYLPIFHLRQKLEPKVSRAQLDQTLYRLQRQEKIDLGSLQEVTAYTQEQINAGIPQGIGGSLFYIIVN